MDDDIYAYEQELNEMDEWEAMHAHELEVAEEEMRAMETVEVANATHNKRAAGDVARAYAPSAVRSDDADVSMDHSQQESANANAADTDMRSDIADAASAIDAKIARAQERLNRVLSRCATLMGEDGDEQQSIDDDARTARHGAHLQPQAQQQQQKKAAAALDAATASFLHSRPPVDVDSLSVVLGDGRRMFLRKKLSTRESAAGGGSVSAPPSVVSPLSLVPVKEMMENIERRQIEATMVKADTPLEDLTSLQPASRGSAPRSNVLWLDKHKPKRFIDLLSDERTNREVLLWLKTWDRFVFPGKKAPSVGSGHASAASRSDSRASGFTPKAPRFGAESSERDGAGAVSEDEDPRPFQKIILICGPPGAGKTTLANIVARHAGYNPIEVNASDDRTASVLKNKIISAMEMQSIFGSRKPNCIILDEIDGAMNGGDGKSAIAAIQDIVSAQLKRSSGKSGKRAGGGGQHPLTRPLICICNDQYASVLRPLRKLAKIFVLDPPHVQRLVGRLKFICKSEGLKTSTGALSALAASGGNDVRYCLNALQFQSTQPGGASVASGLVGQKDQASGVYDALEKVFYQPKSRAKTKVKAAAPTSVASAALSSVDTRTAAAAAAHSSSESPVTAFDEIEEAVHSMGNYALLLQGLDENVPKMMFNDATMSKLCTAFEWLGLADAWDARARIEQQFVFLSYVPLAALAVHSACCTSARRRIEYPRAHFVATQRADKASNILAALVENSQLHASLRASPGVLAVDVVPWLVATLAPAIRRLNPALQSADEKAMIARLIDLMASLGLSFRPKFLPDGSEDYVLEPALHELLEFRSVDGESAGQRFMLPLNVRKMIAREVELQQMRRSESSSKSRAANDASAARTTTARTTTAATAFVLPELSSEKMAEKLEAIRKRNPFAFAHREAKRKRDADERKDEAQQRDTADGGSGGAARPVVRYKFNEGYTCGIITTVYMRDLL